MTTARLRLLCVLTLVSLVVAGLALLPAASAATGITTRASVHSNGTEGTGNSAYPAISADGRYVAFASAAPDLVMGIPLGSSTSSFVTARRRSRPPG
jgi:hypothetical protein